MAARAVDPLTGLDAVPWHRVFHAYGAAVDVPDQLRALRSPDAEVRGDAVAALSGNVYHQGSRWHASCHVVPFLVALIDNPDTPDRAVVVDLLRAVAVGDRGNDDLPFDPHRAFSAADAIGDEQIATVLRHLYPDDERFGIVDDATIQLCEAAAVRWGADAFWAAAEHTASYRRWLTDPDFDVAGRAAELLVWFPDTDRTVARLLALPADRHRARVRASANLALAHLGTHASHVDDRLRQLLSVPFAAVDVTAAVALAYRLDLQLPERAFDILIQAKDQPNPLPQPPGWGDLRGLVALSLQRLGLG